MRSSLRIMAALTCLTVGPAVASAQWSFLVPETEITNATGRADMDSNEMATNGNGLLAVVDSDDSTQEVIVLIDTGASVGSQGTQITTAADIKTAIDAANGTAPDYNSDDLAIQGMGFNTTGKLIVFMDDGTNTGAVVAIDTTSPFAINVLSCAVDAGSSPVEGGDMMFMYDDIAYLLVSDDFGASEDAVLSIDTSTIVNDGSAVVTTVVGAAELLPASGGQSAADYHHNAGCALSATELLVVNSSEAASNDNIIKITLGAPNTAAPFINATEIEAESTATDVGFRDIVVDEAGVLHLTNYFGTGFGDDSVFSISNIVDPNDVTVSVDEETTIAGDVGGSTLFFNEGSLQYDSSLGAILLFSGGTGTEGVLQKIVYTSVNDWTLLED